jgi:hypothetical protein
VALGVIQPPPMAKTHQFLFFIFSAMGVAEPPPSSSFFFFLKFFLLFLNKIIKKIIIILKRYRFLA